MSQHYDALLVLSFGGPERREDVIPFLENVLRGKNVPRERMLAVAEHYYHFEGVSPINEQNRQLIAAIQQELLEQGIDLPVYWGNRNWHPLLADTLRQMKQDGKRRALVFVTSVFGSYSGCRQYLEDIDRARAEVEPPVPELDKLRCPFNHPGFIRAMAERVRDALEQVPPAERSRVQLVFTAHSIPTVMAQVSPYEAQLKEACRLVADAVGQPDWTLVYQSRSGPPSQPWLEPDVLDYLREIHRRQSHSAVVIAPIGFVSDHMEVLYDLDTEARALCAELGLPVVRAATAGVHPHFIAMIRQLIEERIEDAQERLCIGGLPAAPHVCPPDCCRPRRPAS